MKNLKLINMQTSLWLYYKKADFPTVIWKKMEINNNWLFKQFKNIWEWIDIT